MPRRTIRLRLTVLYGVVSVLSAGGLLAITITLAGGWGQRTGTAHVPPASAGSPAGLQAALAQAQARIALLRAQVNQADVTWSHRLLVAAAVGLAVMAGVSVVLGWGVAGRALRPLRAITAATRQISEDDLDLRLAMPGPRDELADLADTIDGLLARLQAAFEAQRNFVANASHELRTPLSATRTMLEVVLADPDASAAALRSTCEDVLAEGQQQERLIDALLTLARSQRGLGRRELHDLARITAGVLRTREPDAARCGVTVSAAMATAPVLGDEGLLRQLAANLIDNALRHNVPHGNLSIHVTSGRGRSTLRISNTGPVIPAAQIGRLLQPFQRLPSVRPADDNGIGLGLGLPIIATIAQAHHATLAISPGERGGLDIQIGFRSGAALAMSEVTSRQSLRITQPEHQPASEQRDRGPGCEDAEAPPRGDRQAVQADRVLDGQPGTSAVGGGARFMRPSSEAGRRPGSRRARRSRTAPPARSMAPVGSSQWPASRPR